MKTITLKVTEPLLRELERAARDRGQSKSEVIRTAIEDFLNSAPAGPPGSLLEALRPWAGCFQGPGDLSTNPQYLEGFGE